MYTYSNSSSLLWKFQKCMHWGVFLAGEFLTSHQLLFVSVQARDLWRRILNTGVLFLFFPKGYSLKRSKCNLNVCASFIEESFISHCLLFLRNSCPSITSLSNQLFFTYTHSTDTVIDGYWADMEQK